MDERQRRLSSVMQRDQSLVVSAMGPGYRGTRNRLSTGTLRLLGKKLYGTTVPEHCPPSEYK